MILLFSDTPDRPIRDAVAYAQAREDAWSAWREIAPGHCELAIAFAELARRLLWCSRAVMPSSGASR